MSTTFAITTGSRMVMTCHTKRLVECSMYEKGKAFSRAAVLVNQKNGNELVVLHLLCQGIEILLKALLLATDYDFCKPRLRKLGHDLIKIVVATRKATNLHIFERSTLEELRTRNSFYSQHLLRYAGNVDIFIDPASIPYKRVIRHVFALIRHVERKGMFKEARNGSRNH